MITMPLTNGKKVKYKKEKARTVAGFFILKNEKSKPNFEAAELPAGY